jgi:hypothetical protein
MRWWRLIVIAMLITLSSDQARAQRPDLGKETPKAMSELDALKIGKLYAERQVLEQSLLKLQAQQEALRLQAQMTRQEYAALDAALGTVVLAAATAVGLTADDLKAGWQPSPERREWVKGN